MEPIKEILAKRQQLTPGQTNYDVNLPGPDQGEETPEQKEIRVLRRFNISTLEHTFEAFKPSGETKQAYEALVAIGTGKSDRKFVLLYGVTGCGKTHLIEALIIALARRGTPAYYRTFSDIARHLKMGLREPDLYDKRFRQISESQVLVIDDYGMGTTESRFEISDLEDIIDLRYRRRYFPGNNDLTVLATNKDIKDLPDRIVSRFYDPEYGVVLFLGETDYRKRQVK